MGDMGYKGKVTKRKKRWENGGRGKKERGRERGGKGEKRREVGKGRESRSLDE